MDSGKDRICLLWNLEGERSKDQGLSFKLRAGLIPQLTRVGCMEKRKAAHISPSFSTWAKISAGARSWVGLVLLLQAKGWRC